MPRTTLCATLVLGLIPLTGCPLVTPATTTPGLRVTTSLGEFIIALDPQDAPLSVDNVLAYVDDGFYDNTLIHRVVPGFVIQGGGFEPGLVAKQTRPPIANEARNGLLNVRGAVALARTDEPDSATSQFFVNLQDNPALDPTFNRAGYAVFGVVVSGMDVVDQIATVATESRDGLDDVPVEDVIIEHVERYDLTTDAQISPEFEAYLQNIGYNFQVQARFVLIQIVQSLLAHP